ncbi:hypothetical protein UMM65_07015 [Aureibaculum sp. 2210JD6-5]|uniref:hypothetical protein n=1 Tax=Aureibaculum sp. 2210JD6-5 TaxID=3103957 RepID=UPI002AAC784D|nr:hypothetical protein [Aureibaculum sp. 2210JD6-5]MDY7394986.1 hypothetical protein [Aureibaculum sp. 2210JD6-5]
MKRISYLFLVLFISAMSFGTATSCKEKKEDPGEKIEEAAEEVGDEIEDAADEVEDEIDDNS